MSDGTKIEWTEATWNPITGCSVTSPGCTNCYAMKLAGTRLQHHPSRAGLTRDSKAGPVWTGEVRFNEQWLDQPLRWKKPRMIFVCAHGDLFHKSVPDQWIDWVFAVMALAPQHTFQVLTKRSARMREYLTTRKAAVWAEIDRLLDAWNDGGAPMQGIRLPVQHDSPWLAVLGAHGARWGGEQPWPLVNVWLGVSVEDQQRADERIPNLLETPAAVRWLSCEPLLGPIDLRTYGLRVHHHPDNLKNEALAAITRAGRRLLAPNHAIIDWIVAGGESGSGARPMHPDWARSIRDQCADAGVPFFFKQWGEWGPDDPPESRLTPPYRDPVMEGAGPCRVLVDGKWQEFADGYEVPLELCSGHGDHVYRLGKKRTGRVLDEQLHDAFPKVRA